MEEKKDIKPIDFTKIVKTLWPHRKKYYYVLPTTLIISYLIIVCIPRYYQCSVSLAPENGGASFSGSISSLASSFGMGGALAKLNTEDAIYSEIYPDVIKSKNFIAGLMPVMVQTKDGNTKCNYYTYLRDKQNEPWWNKLIGKIKGCFVSSQKDTFNGSEKLDIMHLTKVQDLLFSSVREKIKCAVDKKTDIVSITVQDQDPLVCAMIADATCQKLQEFIVNYRTNKARIDYNYYKKLRDEAKSEYEKSLQVYANYSDAHTSTILTSYQAKLESLENEMQAKYNIYTATNAQMQAADAKLQESTPAFTVIESASVPVKPAGPKRMIISIVMMILSFFVLSGWLLLKK